MTQAKRKYIRWTEEQEESIIQMLNLQSNEADFQITESTVKAAMEACLPKSAWKKIHSMKVKEFKEAVRFRRGEMAVKAREFQASARRGAIKPRSLKKPEFALAKQALDLHTRPSTIDLHITAIVRTELLGFEAKIADRIAGRVDDLLNAHARRMTDLLAASEKRLMDFWRGEEPDEEAAADREYLQNKIEVAKKHQRVLVVALHENQHALVRKHLFHTSEHDVTVQPAHLPTELDLDVVILVQDQSLKGYNKEAFDQVIIMADAIGHAMQKAVTRKFGRDKCKMVSGRGPLSVARACLDWYASVVNQQEV